MKKLATLLALLLIMSLAVPVLAEDTVTVMHLTNLQNPASDAPMSAQNMGELAALQEFLAANPGVTVKEEGYSDQSTYQQKIYTMAAGGDLPDVFYLKGSWVSEFVNNGWAVDLTSLLEENPEWKAIFNPGAFDNFTRDGAIYGVPTQSMVTSVVFYNAALFREMGYDSFPTDWEELYEAAAKFKENGYLLFTMGNKANWPAESCWLSTIGDRLTGTDWTNSIISKDGTAKFTDPEFVSALEYFQQLALTPGAFNIDINSLDESQGREAFLNGKAGAIVDGSWMISTLEQTRPEFFDDLEVAILPAIEGGKGAPNTASGGPAWSYALSSKALSSPEHFALAAGVLQAFTGETSNRVALENGEIMSATVEFDKSKTGPILAKFLEMMKDKSTVPIYDAAMDSVVIETMNVGLQELLINAKTPQALAEEIQFQYEMGN
ncbi:MAG: extracellular solute-binding protein [Clostridiales bacterium]|nr:extracellular solute-binding protein [Clostridiales bacterium]